MKHHLAVLKPPYLNRILDGRKRVECRTGNAFHQPPWNCVAEADRLWLKASSGPVVATATVGRVLAFDKLDADRWASLRRQYGALIAAEPEYWRRPAPHWAVLIWLHAVTPVSPFRIAKRDRRAWVVIDGLSPRASARALRAHFASGERVVARS